MRMLSPEPVRDITFADEVSTSGGGSTYYPQKSLVSAVDAVKVGAEQAPAVIVPTIPQNIQTMAVQPVKPVITAPFIGTVITQLPEVKQVAETGGAANFHDLPTVAVKSTRTYWWLFALIILALIGYASMSDGKKKF